MESEVTKRHDIIYYGNVSEYKLAEIYRLSDMLVYPTRSDTYSTVMLEALASGLVCIASDMLKGIFDIFANKGYVHYVKNDPYSFAKAIRELTTKSNTLDRRESYELVKANNDQDLISKEFGKMLKSVYSIIYG